MSPRLTDARAHPVLSRTDSTIDLERSEHLFRDQSMPSFRIVAAPAKWEERKWIAVSLEERINIDDGDA